MMRGSTRAVLLSALLLAFAALAAAIFLATRPATRPNPGDTAGLAAADEAISSGYLAAARDAVLGIKKLPSGEADLLRILKRAFLISRESGDFEVLAAVGSRALEANRRGGPRIRMVFAYAALRTGKLAEAEKVLAGGGLPAETYELLKGETALRRGRQWRGSDSITRELVSLEKLSDPARWLSAAERTGDGRLALDAALLAMGAGDIAKASAIARARLQSAAFDEPAAAMAYDAGDFETAIRRYSAGEREGVLRTQTILSIADCFYALGREEEAKAGWLRSLGLDPAFSWTPFANLALLAQGRSDMPLAERMLALGRERFPRSVELGLAAARIAAGKGERSRAEDILSQILAENPGERGAALLLLELRSPVLSPEGYRAAAWRLFDRYPADREVFNTLFSSLLGARDWEGASVALAQHEEAAGGGDPDNLLFHGLLSAMRGDLTSASKSFRTATDSKKDGIARYDLALVTLAQGGIAGSLALLGTAREECVARCSPERKKTVLSQIDSLTGAARALAGDLEGARKSLANAVALDPGNLRAWLLLRKLEEQ